MHHPPPQSAMGCARLPRRSGVLSHSTWLTFMAPSCRYDWTPLHRASATGRVEFVRALLDHGADVDAISDAGMCVGG